MELRTFTSTTADPVARGRELGRAFAPQFARTAALYLAHFDELGIPAGQARAIAERSRTALAAWAPGLAAEADAIADAAQPAEGVLSLWRLHVRDEPELRDRPDEEGRDLSLIHI